MITPHQTSILQSALQHWPRGVGKPSFPEGRAEALNAIGEGATIVEALYHLAVLLNEHDGKFNKVIEILSPHVENGLDKDKENQ